MGYIRKTYNTKALTDLLSFFLYCTSQVKPKNVGSFTIKGSRPHCLPLSAAVKHWGCNCRNTHLIVCLHVYKILLYLHKHICLSLLVRSDLLFPFLCAFLNRNRDGTECWSGVLGAGAHLQGKPSQIKSHHEPELTWRQTTGESHTCTHTHTSTHTQRRTFTSSAAYVLTDKLSVFLLA